MKTVCMFLSILFLTALSAFAGPFGLNMGMTLEEVEDACKTAPEYIGDDRYYIQPEKSHPLFEGYVAWISESEGLYYIKGISREISCTDYGTEVKQEFSNILAPLERKYGKFKKIDKLSKAAPSYQKSEEHWMMSIASGSRTYEALWQASKDSIEEFDGLVSITLGIKTKASYISNKAYIWLEYGFINASNGFQNLDDVL